MENQNEKLHVYVVDDDDAARKSLCLLLKSHGFHTTQASTADKFFSVLNENSAACIILDLRMPKISGLEIQAQLIERGVRLPVIMLTGHGDVPAAVKAMRGGAIDFIEKPASEQKLLAALKTAADVVANKPLKVLPPQVVKERLERLTKREKEILDQIVLGKTNKLIANELNISQRTVEIHRSRVREKLEAQSLTDLIRMFA